MRSSARIFSRRFLTAVPHEGASRRFLAKRLFLPSGTRGAGTTDCIRGERPRRTRGRVRARIGILERGSAAFAEFRVTVFDEWQAGATICEHAGVRRSEALESTAGIGSAADRGRPYSGIGSGADADHKKGIGVRWNGARGRTDVPAFEFHHGDPTRTDAGGRFCFQGRRCHLMLFASSGPTWTLKGDPLDRLPSRGQSDGRPSSFPQIQPRGSRTRHRRVEQRA